MSSKPPTEYRSFVCVEEGNLKLSRILAFNHRHGGAEEEYAAKRQRQSGIIRKNICYGPNLKAYFLHRWALVVQVCTRQQH